VEHEKWMRQCLDLAVRGQSRVSPNPRVGALLVSRDGTVLGEGWHKRYGGAHAEVNAIRDAEYRYGSDVLRNVTLYVNLEPCNHVGKTPPCVDLILDKHIPRIVVGMEDPNREAAGGIARLRDRGVQVITGVLASACRRLNEPFIHHMATGRPLVTLKIAQTLDGRVSSADGRSGWITEIQAQARGHAWRANVDGILVGSGTAKRDNPSLTVRHIEGDDPYRYILDRTGTLPHSLNVLTDHVCAKTIVVVGKETMPAYAQSFTGRGGYLLPVEEREGHLNLEALLYRLGKDRKENDRPLQSLLVEAGPRLASALLGQNLVDRLYMFIAPKVLGSGLPSFENLGIQYIEEAVTFAECAWEQVGKDILFKGYKRAV